jgi:hypothetical protein
MSDKKHGPSLTALIEQADKLDRKFLRFMQENTKEIPPIDSVFLAGSIAIKALVLAMTSMHFFGKSTPTEYLAQITEDALRSTMAILKSDKPN